MTDVRHLGSEAHPLHCSGLAHVLRCPWRVVSRFYAPPAYDDGGPAAQTGTAMHVAVHAFHAPQGDAASGLAAMVEEASCYPQADLDTASAMFLHYSQDPINKNAKVLLREEKVSFTIKAAADDPTGAPIVVIGTVDQVREDNGIAKVWDLKTSSVEGWNKEAELLHQHTIQLASYCIGASIKLGRRVEPGGLILAKRYMKGQNAHYHAAWSYDDIELIFEGVRQNIAAIRRGNYWAFSGPHCAWCHMGNPDLCLPALQADLKVRRASSNSAS